MKRKLTALISAAAVAVGISLSLSAATAYVVPEGVPSTPTPPYDTKATAAQCINDAVAYALSDDGADIDEIVLVNGTHHTTGQMTITRALTIRGEGGREQVIIDIEKKSRAFALNHPQAVLTGLTLQNANPTKDNTGVTANYNGGCISIESKGGRVEDCIVRNNILGTGGTGGGIWMGSDLGVVSRCVVTNNTKGSTTRGGGIFATKGRIDNCLIDSNVANYGNDLCANTPVAVLNCTIGSTVIKERYNQGHPEYESLYGTFVNCAFLTKQRISSGSCHVTNCAAPVAFEYETEGVGDLVDPVVVTLESMMFTDAARHLSADSSLVNKGVVYDGITQKDLDGLVRVAGDRPDIGCYEVQAAEFSVSFSSSKPQVLVGEALVLEVNVKNPPADATLEYGWTFTPEFGDPIAVTGTTPTLSITTLPPAYYTISLIVTDTAGGTSAAPSVRENYAYVAPLQLMVQPTGSVGEPKCPYADWATAATNIEAALACALPGTSVVLADGVHCTTGTITIASAVTVRGLNGRDAAIVAPCPCPSSAFILDDASATLHGLTITNAQTTASMAHGGAVWIKKGVVDACRIVGAVVNESGRGIAVSVDSDASVLRRTIIDHCTDNSTTYGIVHAIAGLVENCLISDCRAYCPGILLVGDGGFFPQRSQIGLDKVARSTAIVRNCTIVAGTTKKYADYGMLTCYGGSVSNCVLISGNTVVHQGSVRTPDWTPLDVAEDPAEIAKVVSHCCVSTNSTALGSDCVIAAKEKVFKDFDGGDFTLRQGSPCVNAAALDHDWMDGATDLVGAPRVINCLPDIGCYESKYGAGLLLLVR